jgi:hypothetical protein
MCLKEKTRAVLDAQEISQPDLGVRPTTSLERLECGLVADSMAFCECSRFDDRRK